MIRQLKQPQPKSPQTFVDLLRLIIDVAFNEKINYLEISYRKAGDSKVHSVSITS